MYTELRNGVGKYIFVAVCNHFASPNDLILSKH